MQRGILRLSGAGRITKIAARTPSPRSVASRGLSVDVRRMVGWGASILAAGTLAACGTTPTATGTASSPPVAASTHTPQDPFPQLSQVNLCTLGGDVANLQRALVAIYNSEPVWWGDGTQPQTAAVKAQEAQASTLMGQGWAAAQGDARGVLDDIQSLPRSQRPWFAKLAAAARLALKADKAFGLDSTTPWAGPGSTPGVTKAVVGSRLHRDVTEMLDANIVITVAKTQAEFANTMGCP